MIKKLPQKDLLFQNQQNSFIEILENQQKKIIQQDFNEIQKLQEKIQQKYIEQPQLKEILDGYNEDQLIKQQKKIIQKYLNYWIVQETIPEIKHQESIKALQLNLKEIERDINIIKQQDDYKILKQNIKNQVNAIKNFNPEYINFASSFMDIYEKISKIIPINNLIIDINLTFLTQIKNTNNEKLVNNFIKKIIQSIDESLEKELNPSIKLQKRILIYQDLKERYTQFQLKNKRTEKFYAEYDESFKLSAFELEENQNELLVFENTIKALETRKKKIEKKIEDMNNLCLRLNKEILEILNSSINNNKINLQDILTDEKIRQIITYDFMLKNKKYLQEIHKFKVQIFNESIDDYLQQNNLNIEEISKEYIRDQFNSDAIPADLICKKQEALNIFLQEKKITYKEIQDNFQKIIQKSANDWFIKLKNDDFLKFKEDNPQLDKDFKTQQELFIIGKEDQILDEYKITKEFNLKYSNIQEAAISYYLQQQNSSIDKILREYIIKEKQAHISEQIKQNAKKSYLKKIPLNNIIISYIIKNNKFLPLLKEENNLMIESAINDFIQKNEKYKEEFNQGRNLLFNTQEINNDLFEKNESIQIVIYSDQINFIKIINTKQKKKHNYNFIECIIYNNILERKEKIFQVEKGISFGKKEILFLIQKESKEFQIKQIQQKEFINFINKAPIQKEIDTENFHLTLYFQEDIKTTDEFFNKVLSFNYDKSKKNRFYQICVEDKIICSIAYKRINDDKYTKLFDNQGLKDNQFFNLQELKDNRFFNDQELLEMAKERVKNREKKEKKKVTFQEILLEESMQDINQMSQIEEKKDFAKQQSQNPPPAPIADAQLKEQSIGQSQKLDNSSLSSFTIFPKTKDEVEKSLKIQSQNIIQEQIIQTKIGQKEYAKPQKKEDYKSKKEDYKAQKKEFEIISSDKFNKLKTVPIFIGDYGVKGYFSDKVKAEDRKKALDECSEELSIIIQKQGQKKQEMNQIDIEQIKNEMEYKKKLYKQQAADRRKLEIKYNKQQLEQPPKFQNIFIKHYYLQKNDKSCAFLFQKVINTNNADFNGQIREYKDEHRYNLLQIFIIPIFQKLWGDQNATEALSEICKFQNIIEHRNLYDEYQQNIINMYGEDSFSVGYLPKIEYKRLFNEYLELVEKIMHFWIDTDYINTKNNKERYIPLTIENFIQTTDQISQCFPFFMKLIFKKDINKIKKIPVNIQKITKNEFFEIYNKQTGYEDIVFCNKKFMNFNPKQNNELMLDINQKIDLNKTVLINIIDPRKDLFSHQELVEQLNSMELGNEEFYYFAIRINNEYVGNCTIYNPQKFQGQIEPFQQLQDNLDQKIENNLEKVLLLHKNKDRLKIQKYLLKFISKTVFNYKYVQFILEDFKRIYKTCKPLIFEELIRIKQQIYSKQLENLQLRIKQEKVLRNEDLIKTNKMFDIFLTQNQILENDDLQNTIFHEEIFFKYLEEKSFEGVFDGQFKLLEKEEVAKYYKDIKYKPKIYNIDSDAIPKEEINPQFLQNPNKVGQEIGENEYKINMQDQLQDTDKIRKEILNADVIIPPYNPPQYKKKKEIIDIQEIKQKKKDFKEEILNGPRKTGIDYKVIPHYFSEKKAQKEQKTQGPQSSTDEDLFDNTYVQIVLALFLSIFIVAVFFYLFDEDDTNYGHSGGRDNRGNKNNKGDKNDSYNSKNKDNSKKIKIYQKGEKIQNKDKRREFEDLLDCY